MITVVYCCVCFLFVACHSQSILDGEGYSNDSPYVVEPEIQNMRVKMGTQLTLKCDHPHSKTHIIWEFKTCESNLKGLLCDTRNVNEVEISGNTWTRLKHFRSRLDLGGSNKTHNGLYRCLEKGVVKRSFIVEVVGPGNYEGPPPSVVSLKTSNITSQLNMEFTISCNVTSVIPPTIIWFKKCYGLKCDIEYGKICYCHLNLSASDYNIGNTYLSKINVFNARDVDSGLYACLAVTEYGKDYKNVTIKVPSNNSTNEYESFSVLFLIPFALILAPIAVWLCYYKRKKKAPVVVVAEQQKQLIKPVARVPNDFV